MRRVVFTFHAVYMSNPLLDLSDQLAARVEAAGKYVVGLRAHPRTPSSGIHWRQGLVVTTEHTLTQKEASQLLTLPDGRTEKADLVGRDAASGIAAFKLDAGHFGVAPECSDASALRAGHLTVVVGRSTNHGGVTASMGVISSVSGTWRTWQGGSIDHHIRLDMGLYPGSNGGAVVDAAGRVIGLATSAFSRLGAIALPAATVNRVLDSLLQTGYVPRGYLGIGLRPVIVPASLRDKLSSNTQTALILLSVEPASAAEKAGLMVGDLLVAIDGKATTEPEDVQSNLGPETVGRPVNVSVIRGGNLMNFAVTVGERGQE
jgi:S1-C subfamily serine protease